MKLWSLVVTVKSRYVAPAVLDLARLALEWAEAGCLKKAQLPGVRPDSFLDVLW